MCHCRTWVSGKFTRRAVGRSIAIVCVIVVAVVFCIEIPPLLRNFLVVSAIVILALSSPCIYQPTLSL